MSVCTGINKNEITAAIEVFPNPFSNSFTITGIQPNSEIKILSSLGEFIFSEKANSQKMEINLNKYSPGIYYLQIANENEITTRKIIKE